MHRFAHQSSLNLIGLKVWIHTYCLSRSIWQFFIVTENYYFLNIWESVNIFQMKQYFVIIEKRLFNHISQNPYQDIQFTEIL